MYTLNFTLQQHTPIIHFQHDQEGATLRATEVKPKLDKFVLIAIGHEAFSNEGKNSQNHELAYKKGIEIAQNNGWLIGKGLHPALNYKLKFEGNTQIEEDINNPTFFGNIGVFSDSQKKKHIKSQTLINVKIVSEIEIEKILLEPVLESFFLLNNFGSRKSMGSGSYSLFQYKDNPLVNLENSILSNTSLFNLEFLKVESVNDSTIFGVINYYWKRLKSGINYGNKNCIGEYHKSFLSRFLVHENWEKRWLKEKFIGLTPDKNIKKYARAHLGMGDKYTFADDTKLKYDCNKSPEKIAHSFKFEVNVEHSEKEIERIPVPVFFKPLKFNGYTRILIGFHNEIIEKDFTNQEFTFKMTNLEFSLMLGEFKRGKIAFSNIKKKNINQNKFDEYLNKHLKFIKSNPKYPDQTKAFLSFYNYVIPMPEKLRTLSQKLEIKNLLSKYHRSDFGENYFNAIDFKGQLIAKTEIKKIN